MYVIISLILLFIIHKLIHKSILLNDLINLNTNDVYELSETGDLIYFRWNEVALGNEMISPFTHIGMIIEINNKKYIIETHAKGDTKNMGVDTGGVHIYPLKMRLNYYEGNTFLVKIKNEYKPTYDNIKYFIEDINDLKAIPFKENYKDFFYKKCIKRRVCDNCFGNEDITDTLMCSEFVGICLKKLKIVDDTFEYMCLAPYDFQFIKKNNSYIYENIIFKVRRV